MRDTSAEMILPSVNKQQYQGWRICIPLLLILMVLSTARYLSVWKDFDNTILIYYILPSCWILFLVVYYRWIPKQHTLLKLRHRTSIYGCAFFSSAILITVQILIGAFFEELGENPYDKSFLGLAINIYYTLPYLLGREVIRSHVLNVGGHAPKMHEHREQLMILCTILMTMVQLNYVEIISIKGAEELVIYLFQTVVPLVIENVLLNLLVLSGGAMAGIIYTGFLSLFEILFPVLPILTWLTKTVICILIPTAFCFYVEGKMQICQGKRRKREKENLISDVVVLTICVVFVWFFAGVFPWYPSVVMTGSMEPLIDPGDMIIVEKITTEDEVEELKIGDILNFSRDDITITHRIVEVLEDEAGNLSFRTKGDNNSSEDVRLVLPNEVKGTVHTILPKIGIPIMWLKSDKSMDLDKIEF